MQKMQEECEDGGQVCLELPLPPCFSLEKAVCSYGFFMMAPNVWIPEGKGNHGILETKLRIPSLTQSARPFAVGVHISQLSSDSQPHRLCVALPKTTHLSPLQKECILDQVSHMLRLSNAELKAINAFHALHPQAEADGFGRLFRSPTLFEDMVKSLLLCNCGWGRTLSMAKALCYLQAELMSLEGSIVAPITPKIKDVKRKKRQRNTGKSKVQRALQLGMDTEDSTTIPVQIVSSHENDAGGASITPKKDTDADEQTEIPSVDFPCIGAFPSPDEIAQLDFDFLARRCGLGYRAKWISKLAKDICSGAVDLIALERLFVSGALPLQDLQEKISKLAGFGPFTCSNVLVCMGHYSNVPADTETIRHLKQAHGRSHCSAANITREVAIVFSKYAPYQFLAYWFELWGCYEKMFGKLSLLPSHKYSLLTGHNMTKKGSTAQNTTSV